MKLITAALLLVLSATATLAGEVTLAVASNFLTTAEKLEAAFEAETDHSVAISHGSTGQLFAQIDLGAPFDIYLAGDAERPAKLKAAGKTVSTRTYAFGRLALVSRISIAAETVNTTVAGRTLALADPTVAPYGKAATSAMERLGLDTATFRPVLVANVGQVASVFATGNADMAFVAVSQVDAVNAPFILDLENIVPPIRQDAALLKRAADNTAATAFWDWMASEEAQAIILASGYGLPTE